MAISPEKEPGELTDVELNTALQTAGPGRIKNSLIRETTERRLAIITAAAQLAVDALGDGWKNARIAADEERILIDRSGEGI